MSTEEKRQFTRISFVTQVKLSQGDQLWLGHLVDISFKGILVNSRTPLSFDNALPVMAEVSFENGSSMSIKAKQVHHHDQFYGFQFLEMDLDSMSHLRKLILLNLGDETACERELTALFNQYQ